MTALYHEIVDQITEVPATEWEDWVTENGAAILDVREPNEWELGTLPGATRISQGEVIERIGELPTDRPILCVCRSGGRSGNVAMFLAFNGYDVANMTGGMKALGLQD
jgi:rhodanese-related sulfurtransferase